MTFFGFNSILTQTTFISNLRLQSPWRTCCWMLRSSVKAWIWSEESAVCTTTPYSRASTRPTIRSWTNYRKTPRLLRCPFCLLQNHFWRLNSTRLFKSVSTYRRPSTMWCITLVRVLRLRRPLSSSQCLYGSSELTRYYNPFSYSLNGSRHGIMNLHILTRRKHICGSL